MRVWIVAVLGALLVFLSGMQTVQAEQRPAFNALVLAGHFKKVDAALAARLEQAGIRAVVRKFSDPVSPAMLKLFDVVIVPDFEGLATPYFVPSGILLNYLNAKNNLKVVHEYVASGGSVFFSPLMTGGGEEVAEGCEMLLEPWGARALAAQVRDDARAGCEGQYSWTTNIGKSPVSAGVQRIWYPTNQLRWDDAYATVPFALEGNDWQVAVRGMPGSVAAHGWQYTNWKPLAGRTEPVIAAVRTAGKGRVALLGVGSFYTFWMPYATPNRGWVGESNTGTIDGIFLDKGDGKTPSDGLKLLVNTLTWLAEGGRAAGMGGYTVERLAQLPKPASAKLPSWITSWREGNGGTPRKILIGARSTFSDGTSDIPALAAAARKQGYAVLVMTETFERMDPKSWPEFVAACREASRPDLMVMPGIDIADVYQNRYLIMGQRIYPSEFMLSAGGKTLKEAQYLSLGFGTHFTAIHRPTTTPMVQQLYKFFAGIVVYTYRKGALVDDGLAAYEWQIYNESNPLPLVVHEVYSPADVATAARTGHQLYVLSDTPESAAWYLRAGMQHFWETPALFLVTSGPMIRNLGWGGMTAESDKPITEVQLRTDYYPERRWLPNAPKVALQYQLTPSHLRWAFMYVKDADGRTAITPALHAGPAPHYCWRCSDRQNFFGYAMNYTGTTLPDVDPWVPAFGTDEGRGLWPHRNDPRRGENLAPLLSFPYASPAVTITDAVIDQRYWHANWLDVAFDAKASQGTSRSRVYEARVRYYDFNLSEEWRKKVGSRPMMIKEITVRLRMPVTPQGEVFPSFTRVTRLPTYGYTDPKTGKEVTGKLSKGYVDLPVGGYAGDLIALSPGLRVDADGRVGWAAPAWPNGALPTGTTWTARYVKVPADTLASMRTVMGLAGAPPYSLTITRGKLDQLAYAAYLTAQDWSVTGTVTAAKKMPYTLPLFITGLNRNWPAAVVRGDETLQYFGVFEGRGIARLNVTKAGPFFVGNIVTCDAPRLRLTILSWSQTGMMIEANNPTAAPITAVVQTPREITDRFPVKKKITVPAGSVVRVTFGK